jgi:regulatory protein
LAKLRAWRYAGDESFARDWAHSRADARGYGPIKIEHELRAKGIDDAVIVGTLRETFAGNREIHNAREILRKRFGSEKLADPKTSRRAAAFLQRRGYSETVIQDILRPQED